MKKYGSWSVRLAILRPEILFSNPLKSFFLLFSTDVFFLSRLPSIVSNRSKRIPPRQKWGRRRRKIRRNKKGKERKRERERKNTNQTKLQPSNFLRSGQAFRPLWAIPFSYTNCTASCPLPLPHTHTHRKRTRNIQRTTSDFLWFLNVKLLQRRLARDFSDLFASFTSACPSLFGILARVARFLWSLTRANKNLDHFSSRRKEEEKEEDVLRILILLFIRQSSNVIRIYIYTKSDQSIFWSSYGRISGGLWDLLKFFLFSPP